MPSKPSKLQTFFTLGVAFSLWSCTPTLSIPKRSEQQHVCAPPGQPEEQCAELWVSYQIEVEEIDSEKTHLRAEDRCLYYCIVLPAGERVLKLRLNYEAPLEIIRSKDLTTMTLQLEPGLAYRLFDLTAGQKRRHSFTPFMVEGAPDDERLGLKRPLGR